jgi:hypothetical protein
MFYSPMVAYEKTAQERGKYKDQGILLLICKSCDRVVTAYQPISPLRYEDKALQRQKRREKENGAKFFRDIRRQTGKGSSNKRAKEGRRSSA